MESLKDTTTNTFNTHTIYILEQIYDEIKYNKSGRITAEKCIKSIERTVIEYLSEQVQEYGYTLEKTWQEINNTKK